MNAEQAFRAPAPGASIDRIIREVERKQITGLSRTTWWRLERQGLAPKRRALTPICTGWLLSELEAWRDSRMQKVT